MWRQGRDSAGAIDVGDINVSLASDRAGNWEAACGDGVIDTGE